MMKFTLGFILISIFSLSTMAQGLSAHRGLKQTYLMLRGKVDLQVSSGRRLPESQKVDLNRLNTTAVPEISDPALFVSSFNFLRDTRFLHPSSSSFLRRMTWLYPDDGCYARAELESIYAQQHGLPAPAKIFAFGNLRADTNNSPDGFVEWWYHVSIAYKHQGVVYVWDPSVEPLKPLTLQEWGQHIGMDATRVQFALCSAKTFDPDSDCINPDSTSPAQALREQEPFFSYEWSRLKYLGRDPNKELGDEPPWL